MQINNLKAPFQPDAIEWRIGQKSKDKSKGMALAYIDARMVQDRLDEVCGVENWQCRYSHADASSVSYSDKDDKWGKPQVSSRTLGKTICEIGIRIENDWIWKADGAGDTDFEAEKGAISDAFKRAAVKWGIGRYLYDLPAPWVSLDEYGNIQKVELERLRGLLSKDCVRITQPLGLSKTPAKFWDLSSFIVSLPERIKIEGGDWTEEAWEYWIKKFRDGIEKAPNREKLAKFQNDNMHILTKLPQDVSVEIIEAIKIRASQLEA